MNYRSIRKNKTKQGKEKFGMSFVGIKIIIKIFEIFKILLLYAIYISIKMLLSIMKKLFKKIRKLFYEYFFHRLLFRLRLLKRSVIEKHGIINCLLQFIMKYKYA